MKKRKNTTRFFLGLLAVIVFATSCAGPAAQASEVKSDLDRDTSPDASGSELDELARSNQEFAFDLYQALADGDGNLFFSPYSISLALAMTYAGAMGETEREMAETLHFTLSQERLHEALNALDILLESRGEAMDDEEGGFRLNIANAIWGQEGYEFLDEFLDILAENYGAGLRLLDYAGDPEGSRQIINDWVSDQTEGKIKDLIPPGVIDAMTRLVLANAIYFKAGWMHKFEEGDTTDGAFNLLDGSQVQVPMMRQDESFQYTQGSGFQAIELPYAGNEMAMIIILPESGEFTSFEGSLSAEVLDQVITDLEMTSLTLTMPKFEFESEFGLSKTLKEMGMPSAFGADADFSGMDGTRDLYIQDVIHKAFIAVDETGTEAAAATAVIVAEMGIMLPEVEMTIDSPFIFAIRDLQTGSILFLGRVMDPSL
jgi:serpin B